MIWTPPELVQPERGYRFSTDAFLLASFAARFPGKCWCDLGTGSGVIAWELAQRIGGHGIAVERQPELCHYARQNLKDQPVTLIQGDLCQFPWRKDCFDLIVANPPYYDVGAGRINQDAMQAHARHTFYGGICDFAEVMAPSLRQEGHFCFVFPYHLHRRPLEKLIARGWGMVEQLVVRSYEGKEPKLICLALGKSATAEPATRDLVIYRAHREFTDQHQWFLKQGKL